MNTLDSIEALNKIGRSDESRRVIINTITMAMVSDCLHHIYEALICFEKRKFVVGFNLLRKPLLDSLPYLSWVLCREDEFYNTFMSSKPEELTQSKLGNYRSDIFSECIELLGLNDYICADELIKILFKKSDKEGLYMYLQHAVHLVTVQNIELKTQPQNFNFIFKSPLSDDVYENLYDYLPYVMLYLSQVMLNLYNRMQKMDSGAWDAFQIRSTIGYLIASHGLSAESSGQFSKALSKVSCKHCDAPLKLTDYNFGKIILADSFRCSACKINNPFPFSWLF